jgi:hypothetical protein
MALFLGFSQEACKYTKKQGNLELVLYKQKKGPEGPSHLT